MENRRYQIGFLGALEFHCRNVRGEKCAFLIGQSRPRWLRASREKKCRRESAEHENIPIATKGGNCGVVGATVSLNSGVTDRRYLAVSRSSRSGPLKKNATTSLAVASPPHFLAASRGVSLAGWESPPGEARARVSSARARRRARARPAGARDPWGGEGSRAWEKAEPGTRSSSGRGGRDGRGGSGPRPGR